MTKEYEKAMKLIEIKFEACDRLITETYRDDMKNKKIALKEFTSYCYGVRDFLSDEQEKAEINVLIADLAIVLIDHQMMDD